MTKKILLISSSGLILLALLSIAIVSHYNSRNVGQSVAHAHADWTNHFTDIDTFVDEADLIIMGKVVDSIPEQRVDMIFTKQIVEITRLYKGDVPEGSTVGILQTGGTLNGITTQAFVEAPLMQTGEELILFLQETSEEHYLVLGGYQGAGEIVNGNIQFFNEEDEIAQEFSDLNIDAFNSFISLKIEEDSFS